jgi:hypothetical protein
LEQEMEMLSFCRRAALLPFVLVTAGCGAGLGTVSTLGTLAELFRVGLPGHSPQQVEVTAEVQALDMRRQLIQVATTDGRAGGVTYDLSTVVVREQQPYPITGLQPGDVVNLQLQQAAQNVLYASRIEVVQLAREDTAPADTVAAAQLQELTGEVGEIDPERGTFQLLTADRGTFTVSLPFNPPTRTVERFRQLRSGDTVRVEGQPLSGSRMELTRFP